MICRTFLRRGRRPPPRVLCNVLHISGGWGGWGGGGGGSSAWTKTQPPIFQICFKVKPLETLTPHSMTKLTLKKKRKISLNQQFSRYFWRYLSSKIAMHTKIKIKIAHYCGLLLVPKWEFCFKLKSTSSTTKFRIKTLSFTFTEWLCYPSYTNFFYYQEYVSLQSQDQDEDFSLLLISVGAQMSILFSAKVNLQR